VHYLTQKLVILFFSAISSLWLKTRRKQMRLEFQKRCRVFWSKTIWPTDTDTDTLSTHGGPFDCWLNDVAIPESTKCCFAQMFLTKRHEAMLSIFIFCWHTLLNDLTTDPLLAKWCSNCWVDQVVGQVFFDQWHEAIWWMLIFCLNTICFDLTTIDCWTNDTAISELTKCCSGQVFFDQKAWSY
jgi:hypothetical protein